jgi:hypothetical protein
MTGCEEGEILVHDIRTDIPAWSINIPNSGKKQSNRTFFCLFVYLFIYLL